MGTYANARSSKGIRLGADAGGRGRASVAPCLRSALGCSPAATASDREPHIWPLATFPPFGWRHRPPTPPRPSTDRFLARCRVPVRVFGAARR